MHVIANLIWITILAIIIIGIFGWFSLIFVIGLVGIIFSVIYQDDKKKLAIVLVLTAIAFFIWTVMYFKYEL